MDDAVFVKVFVLLTLIINNQKPPTLQHILSKCWWKTCWLRKDVLDFFCVFVDTLTKQKRVVSLLKNKILISLKMPPQRWAFLFCKLPYEQWYGMYVMSLVALYCPTNFSFLFLKEFVQDCAILPYLWIAQSPFFIFYFLKHSSRPDLTSHYSTPKVKLSGRGLARSFICTPVGLNPEPFEFPEFQAGAIPPSQSPLRPECPFCLDKHFDCCVDISLLK